MFIELLEPAQLARLAAPGRCYSSGHLEQLDAGEARQPQIGSFGTRLRHLREAAGLSQEELAEKAALSATAISVLERGERKRPYPQTVRSLADALKLSEEDRASLLAAVPSRRASGSEVVSTAPDATLPRPVTPLVGQEQVLREICDRLGRPGLHLLTLTGVGGVGKTRLAVEAARTSLAEGSFPDGVAFIALAPLRDPALVLFTIARTLGLREVEGQTPSDTLREHLREKRMLLVLDNFEHLLQAAPHVSQLIESCPGPVVLVTSRAPLRVRGEQEYTVPPLALPPSARQTTEDEVLAAPAGRLFVERARAASPTFEVTTENAGTVAAICWRLAGLPLALELAAANVRFLEPADLLPRLDQALSTAWARDVPQHQRTMRVALDWSHDLLSEPQQGLFRRLSLSPGGLSLEAAEAVGATKESGEVLGLLGTLVEHSLVQATRSAGRTQYGMLEPVRQYALDKLALSGEAPEVRQRLERFYLALSERASSELWGTRQEAWLDELDRENVNLRAVLSWTVETEGSEIAGRLCWALWLFWWIRGYHLEGRRFSEAALALQLPAAWRARVLPVAAAMAYAENDHDTAESHWNEALSVSLSEGDSLAEGYSRAGLGLVRLVRGDLEAAGADFGAALVLVERYGDPLVSLVLVWLGTVSLARGDVASAERHIGQGLGSARARGDTLCTYVALYNLAQLALARNDLELAASTLEEGIRLSAQTKDRANLAHFLEALAVVAASRGDGERAALLLGAAEGLLLAVGAPVYNFYNPDPALRDRAVDAARVRLGERAFEVARERGWEMTAEESVAYALS